MVRQFKHHEQKLLKKVDFLNWKQDQNLREIKVIRRYHLPDRATYQSYNTLCGLLRSYAHRLSLLPPSSPFLLTSQHALLSKLHSLALLPPSTTPQLSDVESKLTVSAFCRRRVGVVMCRMGMVQSVSAAVKFVEQGHVRVGTETVTDPAYLVTRQMEDFVTWVDTSKLKRTVMRYNDELDDFDLL